MKKYIKASSGWNNDWRDRIPGDVRERLYECHNTWEDVKIMGKAIKEANPDKDADECATRILDWMDSNGQWRLGCEMTTAEYQELLDYIGTAVDFNEVYNTAYEIYVETENNDAVLQYLEPILGLYDAMKMLQDIKETYEL